MFNRRCVRLRLIVAYTAGFWLLHHSIFSARIRERTEARANLMAIACDEIEREQAWDEEPRARGRDDDISQLWPCAF